MRTHLFTLLSVLFLVGCQQVRPAKEVELPPSVVTGKVTGHSAGQSGIRLEYIKRQADDIEMQARQIDKTGAAPETPITGRLVGDTTQHARDLATLKDQVAAAYREAQAAEDRNAALQADLVNLRDEFARLHQGKSAIEAALGDIKGKLAATIATSTMWKALLTAALVLTNGAWLAWLFLVRR